MKKNSRAVFMMVGALLFSTASAVVAQDDFPTRPIRLVVPFTPGSGTDNTARYLAREMELRFKSPVVVENQPGANSFIAAKAVAGAAADGYTLLVSGSSAMTVNQALFKELPYDPLKDFAPVARLAQGAMGLAVSASSPYQSVPDLVNAMREKEGSMNYGSGAASYFITTELFLSLSKAKAVHVPYKGAAQALTDLVGEQIDFVFADYAALVPFLNSGRLRMLAVTSADRLESAPDIPTISESGYPGFEMVNWTSVFAPAGTSDHVIRKLSDAIVSIYEQPEALAFLATTNWSSIAAGPDILRQYQIDEIAKWGDAAKIANIEKQ